MLQHSNTLISDAQNDLRETIKLLTDFGPTPIPFLSRTDWTVPHHQNAPDRLGAFAWEWGNRPNPFLNPILASASKRLIKAVDEFVLAYALKTSFLKGSSTMRSIPFEKLNSPEYSADADELARLAKDVLGELQAFLLIVDRLFLP